MSNEKGSAYQDNLLIKKIFFFRKENLGTQFPKFNWLQYTLA